MRGQQNDWLQYTVYCISVSISTMYVYLVNMARIQQTFDFLMFVFMSEQNEVSNFQQ